ncbi:MAG TPA: amidohydrolase family protein [Tepidisphaeraceae bacterium]|jgi:guanine deaminase
MTITGSILNVLRDGNVQFLPDGALACDAAGVIAYAGPRKGLPAHLAPAARPSGGIILPPFLDAHIHIPQHPIRGRFMEGVEDNPPLGRLLAGLNRNVFPTESKCSDDAYTRATVQAFLEDTLAKGVVGGAAYMTVHPRAVRIALEMLPETWSVGLVLMNMNCPEYLRTDEKTLEKDVRALAAAFGKRLIVTDRFAVAVDTPLRKRAAKLAEELGLRMQTHLNEQRAEKAFVEKALYPGQSYTGVYQADGLMDREPILAHCIHMTRSELEMLKRSRGAVAHCPTSNTLLGSGVMKVPDFLDFQIPYAICTDVGASPTTSMLAEMSQYVKVHAPFGPWGSPSDALFRSTLAPAQILGLDQTLGSFEVGKPMSFIEVEAGEIFHGASADEAIQLGLLGLPEAQVRQFCAGSYRDALEQLRQAGLDHGAALTLLEDDVRQTAHRLNHKVLSVTLSGKEVFRRG